MDENSRHMNFLQQQDQAELSRKKWLLWFRAMQASKWFVLWGKEMRGRANAAGLQKKEWMANQWMPEVASSKRKQSGTGLVDDRISISLPRLINSLSWFWYRKDNHVSFRDLLKAMNGQCRERPCRTRCSSGENMAKTQKTAGCGIKEQLGAGGTSPSSSESVETAWLQCCLLLLWLLCQKTPWPQYLW